MREARSTQAGRTATLIRPAPSIETSPERLTVAAPSIATVRSTIALVVGASAVGCHATSAALIPARASPTAAPSEEAMPSRNQKEPASSGRGSGIALAGLPLAFFAQ
jgi:hypothetical protein